LRFRGSVEQEQNTMLDAEADELCGAIRNERTPKRLETRARRYERTFLTKGGEEKRRVPRLQSLPVETQIIECYQRRQFSVEEAMMEMYLAGV
jgi:putative transposase